MENYKRILLKLSGEALGDKDFILSKKVLDDLLYQIKFLIKKYKIQIAIVVGGGNIWRGENVKVLNMNLERADYMGMMATSINALGLTSYFNEHGLKTIMQNSLDFEKISPILNIKNADAALKKNQVVVYGGGTGKPFLSTDTAAAMRAIEINADVIFMAKNGVDGVYTKDPNKFKDATFLPNLTFKDIIKNKYAVVDQKAMNLLKNKNIELLIFNMNKSNNIINLFENAKTKKTIVRKE